ncbi:MAG: 3-oxoacyl-[acyl-carrier-protein] reductase [bacterium]|nr:3-oxoacyl-[acyl-carrier-protein] reductase [bacterium]
MTRKLKDKVALITGSGQGIGREIALKLASEGSNICVTDVNLTACEETAKLVREHGVRAETYQLDVSKMSNVTDTVSKILDNFAKIDILVNNAGITRDGLLMRMSEDDWDLVLDINLKGTFNCTKVVSKAMMKEKYGKIVNIASIVGVRGNAGQANYSASKGGVIAFTKTCSKELGARNINVNAVAPGFISTKMTDALSDNVKKNMIGSISLKKFGSPTDVANVTLFLVSQDSDYITGQTINVDGGIIM